MKVIVESYKPGGKWYTDGEYETAKEHMFEIFDEVAQKALEGDIPGLCGGAAWTSEPNCADWILRVTAPDHELGYPGLIPLFRDEHGKRTLNRPELKVT